MHFFSCLLLLGSAASALAAASPSVAKRDAVGNVKYALPAHAPRNVGLGEREAEKKHYTTKKTTTKKVTTTQSKTTTAKRTTTSCTTKARTTSKTTPSTTKTTPSTTTPSITTPKTTTSSTTTTTTSATTPAITTPVITTPAITTPIITTPSTTTTTTESTTTTTEATTTTTTAAATPAGKIQCSARGDCSGTGTTDGYACDCCPSVDGNSYCCSGFTSAGYCNTNDDCPSGQYCDPLGGNDDYDGCGGPCYAGTCVNYAGCTHNAGKRNLVFEAREFRKSQMGYRRRDRPGY